MTVNLSKIVYNKQHSRSTHRYFHFTSLYVFLLYMHYKVPIPARGEGKGGLRIKPTYSIGVLVHVLFFFLHFLVSVPCRLPACCPLAGWLAGWLAGYLTFLLLNVMVVAYLPAYLLTSLPGCWLFS
ncbi:hypothetical protein F5X97DRAFT_129252 [Nemania serpens]|nr:hypothetical protein F5X97DRAFT_129252 [Nemania serpens]